MEATIEQLKAELRRANANWKYYRTVYDLEQADNEYLRARLTEVEERCNAAVSQLATLKAEWTYEADVA